jgi:hypothetical protein
MKSKEFYDDMHEGNVIVDLVRGLLQESGYLAYLNGYEERFSQIKEQLNDKVIKNSRTVRMIRSSPDLLVYDKNGKDALFVEVKMRRAPKETSVLVGSVEQIVCYKEFWRDAILVIAIPCGSIFYAQRFSELETKEMFNAETDFEKFEHFFTAVREADLERYRAKAIQTMKK